MVAVRLVELFFLAAWLFGLWLVWTRTRHTLLLGMRLLAHFGWHELEPAPAASPRRDRVLVSPSGAEAQSIPAPTSVTGDQPVPRRIRSAIFVVGLALPHAAFTAATMVGLYLYDWIGVPS
jgi:hypothetical protein